MRWPTAFLLCGFVAVKGSTLGLELRNAKESTAKSSPLNVISYLNTNITVEKEISDKFDSIVLVSTEPVIESWNFIDGASEAIEAIRKVDKTFNSSINVINANGKRVIYSPTGKLDGDYVDVRTIFNAAASGISRAMSAGSTKPLIVIPKKADPFSDFSVDNAVVSGVLKTVYVTLPSREKNGSVAKVENIGFMNFHGDAQRMKFILSSEAGRVVYRDIAMGDPERMTPKKVEQYVSELFPADGPVKMTVVSDEKTLIEKYPCLAAVDRCARHVPRHAGRIIFLEYNDGTPEKVLGFVGKGVTFDAGGVNVKQGSGLSSMSRDKTGAAAVAGLFQSLNILRPKNVRVLGALCLVRNSVGADSYMVDEILTSRAGKRIQVTNTDAEGRLAMVDALADFKERVLADKQENKTQLFTVATLTGSAKHTFGFPYIVALDNGPAKKRKTAADLQFAGEQVGDFLEISQIRKEDFSLASSTNPDSDILQTVGGGRGFQFPAAFLIRGSGLDSHDSKSERPIAYTHLDIAATYKFPSVPEGSPLAAFNYKYFNEESVNQNKF